MAQIKFFLHLYRWWILVISSLLAFALIFMLATSIINVREDASIMEKPDQLPTTVSPTHATAMNTPTHVQEVILESEPSPEEIVSEFRSRQLAYVQRVIDGDSIEVIIDGELYQLRYIGVDAPEIGMPLFNEASEANRSFVERQIVELERDISDADKYGRLLRYIYLPDGRLLNAEMVALGLATADAYPPDIKYQEAINSSEQIAKNAGLGLWAPLEVPTLESSLEPGNHILIDPSCSQFNAPGNDNDNKNEEFVCLTNNGPQVVELSGWSIHDEYGWTYHFPLFNLEGNTKVRIMTGCGPDSPRELFWCKDETAVWNNDGDCVYLINSEGIEAAKYCY